MGEDTFDGTELDFWIGSWAVSWDGGQGTNRVTRILRDRVVLEVFDEAADAGEAGDLGEAGALHGRSWSVFDAGRGLWRQTWVDDQGSYLDLVGTRVDGWFAFERAAPEHGPDARQRMVFRDVLADGFRWHWQSSADAGGTWTTRWEIDYRRLDPDDAGGA